MSHSETLGDILHLWVDEVARQRSPPRARLDGGKVHAPKIGQLRHRLDSLGPVLSLPSELIHGVLHAHVVDTISDFESFFRGQRETEKFYFVLLLLVLVLFGLKAPSRPFQPIGKVKEGIAK